MQRISKTLRAAVCNTAFELELPKHEKLKRIAAARGISVNQLLRDEIVPWLDSQQDVERN